MFEPALPPGVAAAGAAVLHLRFRGPRPSRNEIGDIATTPEQGGTEAGPASLARIDGRTTSILTLPNGKTIHNMYWNHLYWNHLFKEYDEVHQFQVRIKTNAEVEFLLKGNGFTEMRETDLRARVSPLLTPLKLRIRWVSQIPLTGRGKLLQVVRED